MILVYSAVALAEADNARASRKLNPDNRSRNRVRLLASISCRFREFVFESSRNV